MADKAATRYGSPGETVADPSAVVGVLGEIENQYSASGARTEDDDLPPLNLGPLRNDKANRRSAT